MIDIELLLLVVIAVILVLLTLLFLYQMGVTGKEKSRNSLLEKQIENLNQQVAFHLKDSEKKMQEELFLFRTNFESSLKVDFDRLAQGMDRKMLVMQEQVDQKMQQNHTRTTKTFEDVLERLTKIDAAQKKLDDLTVNISSLENILNDKKARGTFGEIQLENIFTSVFGVNNEVYQRQYTLSNNTIVDLMLFAPPPMGAIAIDSKFPLENYRRIIDSSGHDQVLSQRQFKADIKKHIDDIARKYILPGETASNAILFLPAEAVFSYLQAYHQEIVTYGYEKGVWIASPSTLMALLTTLQAVLKDMERDKYASIIREELILLSKEFERYQIRWEQLSKRINQVSQDVKDVSITSDKISSRFNQIEGVELTQTQNNEMNNKE